VGLFALQAVVNLLYFTLLPPQYLELPLEMLPLILKNQYFGFAGKFLLLDSSDYLLLLHILLSQAFDLLLESVLELEIELIIQILNPFLVIPTLSIPTQLLLQN
jgi:hypothetical protein